jgi:transposase
MDRDVNSARNILKMALERLADPIKSVLPVDCGEVKPVEWELFPR